MSRHVPPRAVLFDLDGTLVDSLPSVAGAMAEAMRRHGFSVDPAEVVPRIGPPMNVLVEEMTGCPPAQAACVNELFMELYYGDFIEQTEPCPGADDLLDRLRDADVGLGVLTNKVERGGHQMLRVMGWTDRFQVVVGRDTVERSKPAPDGALYALDRLGATPAEAALVGDTEFDMGCGRDGALRYVVGVPAERSAAQLREAGATHVVESLADVGRLLLDGVGAAQP